MHACTTTEQDLRQVEASSMPIEFATGAGGRRLQHPDVEEEEEISLMEEIH